MFHSNIIINDIIEKQIDECINLVVDIFSDDLIGVYLYGSTLLGGIQKYSDIDLFVISNRSSTFTEKDKLVKSLFKISGVYMKSKRYPMEITIAVQSEINPWQYPPRFDFQYGEWLRTEFEQGNIELWQKKEMPDLALLITQLLLSNKTLIGVEAEQVFCKVPYKDFVLALKEELPGLMDEIEGDIHNVLLTLARMWSTIENDMIYSKSSAVEWAIDHIPKHFIQVLEHAKAIYLGEEKEYLNDLKVKVKPCADYIANIINIRIREILQSNIMDKSIKLAPR